MTQLSLQESKSLKEESGEDKGGKFSDKKVGGGKDIKSPYIIVFGTHKNPMIIFL